MAYYVDIPKLRIMDRVEEVKERNMTKNLGDHRAAERQANLIAGVVSEINRKGVTDPRKQMEIVDKVKKYQNWRTPQ
jgi:uncharacterized protein YpuA (DUF1002 family)